MVGESNKILTVSYGTFSCTLEGFDDPFSTMRGIAEYFRDLAADDRYFGAEPPTPDVEMLQRIAEKEVQNRVEKKINDGGVVLRQVAAADSEDAFETISDAKEENIPFSQGDASIDADDIAEADAPVATDDYDEEASNDDVDVQVEATAGDEETEDSVAEEIADVLDGPDVEEAEAAVSEATTDLETDTEFSESGASSEMQASEDVPVEDTFATADASPEAYIAPEASETVPDHFEKEEPAEDVSETDRVVSTPLEIFTERLETITGAAVETREAEPVAFEDAVETATADESIELDVVGDDKSFEDKLARIQAAVAASDDFGDEFEGEEATSDLPEGYEVAAEVTAMKREAFGAVDEPEAAAREEANAFVSNADEDDDEPSAGSMFADIDAGAEADDSFAEGSADEADISDVREALGTSSLSDDDEADLAAELAEIERSEQEEIEARIEEEARAERTRPISRPLDAHDESVGVNRLLEEADHQFQDDESSRRRSAIAHLKAAVAATKADELIRAFTGKDKSDEEETNAYREDLSRVVKPQSSEELAARAVSESISFDDATPSDDEDTLRDAELGTDVVAQAETESKTERPAPIDTRPAPLMLVSEQRVDGDEPTVDGASIKPKRVEEPEGEEDTGFSEFARDMGASELSDLLEAAAAYAAFVEGEPHFSRPQLMRRVAQSALVEDFSREAGLRTFGQLLRQGRLQKLKRGQFTVSSETRFNPESRIAGE